MVYCQQQQQHAALCLHQILWRSRSRSSKVKTRRATRKHAKGGKSPRRRRRQRRASCAICSKSLSPPPNPFHPSAASILAHFLSTLISRANLLDSACLCVCLCVCESTICSASESCARSRLPALPLNYHSLCADLD